MHIDGAIFDITARKHLEEQWSARADGGHRQVAATVSHELRNPLGAISNSMAFLRQMTANRQLGIEKALRPRRPQTSSAATPSSPTAGIYEQKELSRAPRRSRPG